VVFVFQSPLALELSPADAPRIAMVDAVGTMNLASCDTGCDLLSNWTVRNVTSEVSVDGSNFYPWVDLALDPSDRPLFAYRYEGMLRFAAPGDEPPSWGVQSTMPGPVKKGHSDPANTLLLFLVPTGALWLMRNRMKRRTMD